VGDVARHSLLHIGMLAVPGFFAEQVENSDIIVFNGGDATELIYMLDAEPGWRNVIMDKTIIAHSAGISAMALKSYNRDGHGIINGCGLLPFQTIVHFDARRDWHLVGKLYEESHLPVLTLADSQPFVWYC
jgi:hypothetical protein